MMSLSTMMAPCVLSIVRETDRGRCKGSELMGVGWGDTSLGCVTDASMCVRLNTCYNSVCFDEIYTRRACTLSRERLRLIRAMPRRPRLRVLMHTPRAYLHLTPPS